MILCPKARIWQVVNGYYSDGDVSVQKERPSVYLASTIGLLLALIVLNVLGAPRIALACFYIGGGT
jgi:hypothetical protein